MDVLSYEFDCTNNGSYDFGPQPGNTATCQYDDGPTAEVAAVRVTDTSSAAATATIGVNVNSVAPTGTFNVTTPVFEGSPSTLSWTGVTDPSNADTLAGFRYSFACNGNIGSLTGSYLAAQLGNSTTCTYFDNDFDPSTAGNQAYPVAGRVLDKNNASQTTGGAVTVVNVDPTLSNVAITAAVFENGTATLTGTISDPGTLDSFTLVVTWGDGATSTYRSLRA